MASLHIKEEYTLGEDVDFDQLNENRLKHNITNDEMDQLLNPEVESNIHLTTSLASPTRENRVGFVKRTEQIRFKELPSERLNRLRREVRELKEELQLVVEKEKETKIINPATNVALLKEIESMQNSLANIYENEGLAKGIKEAANVNESDKGLLSLKDNIKHYKAEALLSKLKGLQKPGNTEEGNIIYNIKTRGAEEDQIYKIEGLENRVAKLEKSFENSNFLNLLEEVEKVRKNVETLLAGAEFSARPLESLSSELDTLAQKRQAFHWDDPRLIKVEKMHGAFLKLQIIGENLPSLINRLECLKLIHEESAGINDKIRNLTENKYKITEALGNSSHLLKQVGDSLNENLPRIINEIGEIQNKLENTK